MYANRENTVHKNLHIIAECIYANRENKRRKSIQLTKKNTNWVSDLKNALNSRINDIEHTNINHTQQQEYELITDEQEIKLPNTPNIDKPPERQR